jgi:hypothetical protein
MAIRNSARKNVARLLSNCPGATNEFHSPAENFNELLC